jgi:hypothetical protein
MKFVASPVLMPWIEQWIGTHAAGFFEAHPPRQVNSLYLDTFDLDAYRDNLSGSSSRFKVRFRWYGEEPDTSRGALEVKRRENGLGYKETFVTGPVSLSGTSWRDLRRLLRSELAREALIWLDGSPLPVLINRYWRRYFVSADSRVRVTVDWAQRVYDQRTYAAPNLSRHAHLPDTAVVEFKFSPEDRPVASALLQGFPLRVGRNSKYVIGVQATLWG